MSVVGIDVGNENCVIAVAKQRGIDVALNEESRRETPAMVCFGEKQRFLGTTAASSATLHPQTTISQIKRLIAQKFRDPDVQSDLKILPYKTTEAPDGGILIVAREKTYTPTQILGMLLSHLKSIAQKCLDNQTVSDCVIGIPAYYTETQRHEYLNAAIIANLNPLRLMHEAAAIALSYGIYKSDLPATDPLNVVFVDIGHSDIQVSVVAFKNGDLKVLSHAFDRSLGGRDFDNVLFDHFAKKFYKEYGINVSSSARASLRLRTACEKLKKVLSANTEAPLSIECLMDEKDVKGFIKREEFESMSSGLLERLKVPCQKALDEAKLNPEVIETIEVVGSGSRIPAILRTLKDVFRKEPSRTLNASECIARGCALQCAMLSPTFRVRDFQVKDTFPYSIVLSVAMPPLATDKVSDSVQPYCVTFSKGFSIPSSKVIALPVNGRGSIILEANYENSEDLPLGTSPKIGSFTIGLEKVPDLDKAKVKAIISINLYGVISVESKLVVDAEPGSSKRFSNIRESEKHNLSKNSPDSGTRKEHTNNHSQSDPGVDANMQAEAAKTSQKGRSRKYDLPVLTSIPGFLSRQDLQKFVLLESRLSDQDKMMEETKDKKNAVESYVYDMRNKLLDKYQSYAKVSEKEDLSQQLEQTENWLYDEGDDQSKEAYIEKLGELKKIGDVIEHRFKEEELRTRKIRDLEQYINHYRKVSHVDLDQNEVEERKTIINKCDIMEKWLLKKQQQQSVMPKNEDPVLLSSEIERRISDLDRTCKQILSKPRLPPPKSSSGPMDTDPDQPDEPDDMQTD